MKSFVALMILSLALVGCGDSKQKKAAKAFEAALEAETNQTWTLVKLDTEKGNFSVYRNENTGEYVAYNMDRWDMNTMTTYAQFAAVAVDGDIVGDLARNQEWIESGYWDSVYDTYTNTWEEYDSYCDCYVTQTETVSVYVGEVWVDTSHWYTFYTGGGFRFSNTAGVSRDLETIAALKEETAVKFMAHKLKTELSLSEGRAQEMARLASRYQRLENARELTVAEKNTFAMSALGVNMNQVEVALRNRAQGREQQYRDLLNTAARVNSTTPEQIGKFFDKVVGEI